MASMGSREGLGHDGLLPLTEFRTTITSREGLGRTVIIEGRIFDVDTVNWTVHVFSQFDQMRFLDIPVASPYLHSNRGDGIYVMPEVGAKVIICWPADSSPPFVLAFIMSHESEPITGAEDAPLGTGDRSDASQTSANVSFAGGRQPRAKPGDIFLRGRDGQFITLHRGGVLQIGANELSQRVYIPLGNLMMDFAENYRMHTAGGSITWGLQESKGKDNLSTEHMQTFRVFANDEFADIRIAAGKVHQPVPEPSDTQADVTELMEDTVTFDFALARNGFRADDGALIQQTTALSKLRFHFDRDGNALFRTEGNLVLNVRKKLRMRVDDDVEIFAKKNFILDVKGDVRVTTGGTLEFTAGVVKLPSADLQPVARQTDQVAVVMPPELVAAAFAPAIPPPTSFSGVGVIVTGNPKVLA